MNSAKIKKKVKAPVPGFVVLGCHVPRAGPVVDAEIVKLRITPEEIAPASGILSVGLFKTSVTSLLPFFVYHELLDQLSVLCNIQV